MINQLLVWSKCQMSWKKGILKFLEIFFIFIYCLQQNAQYRNRYNGFIKKSWSSFYENCWKWRKEKFWKLYLRAFWLRIIRELIWEKRSLGQCLTNICLQQKAFVSYWTVMSGIEVLSVWRSKLTNLAE